MKKIIIGVLTGFILGFSGGMLFYAKLLDKPEVVNQNKIKQKIKGRGNNAKSEYVIKTKKENES